MLSRLWTEGIDLVACTPHYYPTEVNQDSFLRARDEAVERLVFFLAQNAADGDLPKLVLGAEVYLTRDIASDDISELAYTGTNHILIELPYTRYDAWMAEEIWNVSSKRRLVPVIAHLDRYLSKLRKENIEDLLDIPGVVIQINTDAFFDHNKVRFVQKLADREIPVVLGSDAHNITTRPPDFSEAYRYLTKKKAGEQLLRHIHNSDFLLPV
jgi:protein-tyrosine phosphatase